MRRCQKCETPDQTAQARALPTGRLRVLCAECYVDERTSSTRRVAFKAREVEDRYTLLARKYGL